MKLIALLLPLVLLTAGCKTTPDQVSAAAGSPAVLTAAEIGDAVASALLPPLAHLTDVAGGIKETAEEIKADRAEKGQPANAPLGTGDWLHIGEAIITAYFVQDKLRNAKYVKAGQAAVTPKPS